MSLHRDAQAACCARPATPWATKVIPHNVRRFVMARIRSVPYLEAALFLRAHPDTAHRVADVAKALYVAEDTAAGLVDQLVADGVAAALGEAGDVRFRYQPRDEALAADFDALDSAYAANLVEIARLVHDSTYRNAHRFADAFRLRKD